MKFYRNYLGERPLLSYFVERKEDYMAVKNKDKGATVSAPSRTITADEVRIENGVFVDEEGNIAERVAGLLVNPSDCFKVTIKIELPEEDTTE